MYLCGRVDVLIQPASVIIVVVVRSLDVVSSF